MTGQNMIRFQKHLPHELIQRAISLEEIGVDEYAWMWGDALEVIQALGSQGILILGGDVYSVSGGRASPTYDNWYVNPSNLVPTSEDIRKAQQLSDSYVRTYAAQHGNTYYYSITAKLPYH